MIKKVYHIPTTLSLQYTIRHRQGLLEPSDFGGMVQTHMMWEVIGTGHVE